MLQRFTSALKSKASELFAEEDDDGNGGFLFGGLDEAGEEGAITGLPVLRQVDKEHPASSFTPLPLARHRMQVELQRALVSSLFAAVSSFHTAYLHLQTAHEPLRPDSIKDADRTAVSHLQRLSDLRLEYCGCQSESCGAIPSVLRLPSCLEAEVLDNQCTLRKYEAFLKKLQLEVDQKDADAANLKQQLSRIENCNMHLERKLEKISTTDAEDEKEKKLLLSVDVGMFDTVLREACDATHRFTKILIDLMKTSGWDLEAMGKSIYPGVEFVKRGHRGYALFSYICLGMFSGFGTAGFGGGGGTGSYTGALEQRREFLRRFVEYRRDDPIDLLNENPHGDFARFCERKYHLLIHHKMESYILEQLPRGGDSGMGLWNPTSPLYEPFVCMCSSVWMLHQLAMAFDRPVEMFQVQQGADLSMVYMENVVRRRTMWGLDARRKRNAKVAFTVAPGFRLGGVVIQCRVYADYR